MTQGVTSALARWNRSAFPWSLRRRRRFRQWALTGFLKQTDTVALGCSLGVSYLALEMIPGGLNFCCQLLRRIFAIMELTAGVSQR